MNTKPKKVPGSFLRLQCVNFKSARRFFGACCVNKKATLVDVLQNLLKPTFSALRCKKVVRTFYVSLTLLFSLSVYAVDPISPISGGMGGAGIAGVAPQDVSLNPGTIPHSKGYHIGVGHLNYKDRLVENKVFKAGISDNQPGSRLPAGLMYIQQEGTYRDLEEIYLALGKFIAPKWTIGLGITRMEQTPKLGSSLSLNNTAEDWDVSIGTVYTPYESLGLGAVFYNMLSSEIYDLRSAFGLGIHYLYLNFVNARLDLIFPLEENENQIANVRTGFESQVFKDTFLRFGYAFDDDTNHAYWSTGLGWNGPKLGLDYSFKRNIDNSGDYHTIQARIYF